MGIEDHITCDIEQDGASVLMVQHLDVSGLAKEVSSQIDEQVFQKIADVIGYEKKRTCRANDFINMCGPGTNSVCRGYHILSCGHKCPGDYDEPPSFCPACGAEVVAD